MTRYFDEGEYKDLLKYEGRDNCQTINIIKKKHKTGLSKLASDDLSYLKLPETPTNQEHSQYLDQLDIVYGVTNHAQLFS